MIAADTAPDRASFADRLARKAVRIAEAHLQSRRLEQRTESWRKPRLLWPLFAQE